MIVLLPSNAMVVGLSLQAGYFGMFKVMIALKIGCRAEVSLTTLEA